MYFLFPLIISNNLIRVADIYGKDPGNSSVEVLYRFNPVTPYTALFSINNSYINFQCVGTNYDNFHCEMDFHVEDIYGNALIDIEKINCYYGGTQSGKIIISDNRAIPELGTIYVYTPYWCRWQFEYDVDNSGTKTLLTFEFWKGPMNPLPDFANNEE